MVVVQISRRALSATSGLRNGGLHMFLPNEMQYVFKGERLSPQENILAIPHRPQPNGKKFYNDIMRPDQSADLITKFSPTEVITTCLSSNSALQIVAASTGNSEPVELYFTNVATKWIEDFNKLVFPLTDIPMVSPTFYRYKVIEDLGLQVPQVITSDWLNQVMDSNKIVMNSSRVLQGKVLAVDAASLATFELLVFWLLGHESVKGLDGNISILIASIGDNFNLIPLASLETLVGLLVHNLHCLDEILDATFQGFNSIVNQTVSITGDLYLKMTPAMADTLAFEFIRGNNLSAAKEVLQALVNEAKLAPSSSTVDALLNAYSSKDKAIVELAFLKPVFFHRDSITPQVLLFLLTNSVKTVADLNKILELLEGHGKDTLEKYQYEIFNKLGQFPYSEVQLTQMIKRFVLDNDVKLNETVVELIGQQYKSLGSEQYYKRLNDL